MIVMTRSVTAGSAGSGECSQILSDVVFGNHSKMSRCHDVARDVRAAPKEQKMTSSRECVFCKIVAGTSPCQEIYQDGAVLSFMDIHSGNDGHCLVIPNMHLPSWT
jgi:hypothetical protein